MVNILLQYISDSAGKELIIISAKEFKIIVEQLKEFVKIGKGFIYDIFTIHKTYEPTLKNCPHKT